MLYGQEIDASMIQNLSPAQIEMAKSSYQKVSLLEKPRPCLKESTKRAS